jgi:anti-sigma factor RsiW
MPATEDLTCRELVEIVTEYLEGTLPRGERERFHTHLLDCPGCTTYLDQMRETIRLTGRLGEDGLAPTARDDLLAALRDRKRRT